MTSFCLIKRSATPFKSGNAYGFDHTHISDVQSNVNVLSVPLCYSSNLFISSGKFLIRSKLKELSHFCLEIYRLKQLLTIKTAVKTTGPGVWRFCFLSALSLGNCESQTDSERNTAKERSHFA